MKRVRSAPIQEPFVIFWHLTAIPLDNNRLTLKDPVKPPGRPGTGATCAASIYFILLLGQSMAILFLLLTICMGVDAFFMKIILSLTICMHHVTETLWKRQPHSSFSSSTSSLALSTAVALPFYHFDVSVSTSSIAVILSILIPSLSHENGQFLLSFVDVHVRRTNDANTQGAAK